jgi:general secretion pathway protein M
MKTLLAPLAQRWSTMAARERQLVSVAITVVVLALIWWVGVAPALKTLREANAARGSLDAQLQSMRAVAAEASRLKGQRSLSAEESLRALQASTQQSFGSAATLSNTESRATITLKGASADALAVWLSQTRINARLVPAEMKLARSVNNSSTTTTAWDGLIVINLPQR